MPSYKVVTSKLIKAKIKSVHLQLSNFIQLHQVVWRIKQTSPLCVHFINLFQRTHNENYALANLWCRNSHVKRTEYTQRISDKNM